MLKYLVSAVALAILAKEAVGFDIQGFEFTDKTRMSQNNYLVIEPTKNVSYDKVKKLYTFSSA
jgi:hypothetical protein